MKVSRRGFLAAATPLAIAAALPIKGLALDRIMFSGKGDPLARLTWDSFLPYVGTDFVFSDAEGNAVDLRLERMDDTRPANYKPRGDGDECFALIFSGPRRKSLIQDTYSVGHFALGDFSLMITVLQDKNARNQYEAVINRIRGGEV